VSFLALPIAAAAKTALKKLAIASVTDKRTGKTVLGIIGGIVFALITPVLALLAVLQSGAELDMSVICNRHSMSNSRISRVFCWRLKMKSRRKNLTLTPCARR
jgi:hypothetical protein